MPATCTSLSVDSVAQNIESVTVGSFGYERYLTLGSAKAGDGNLLYAGEFTGYDGPWTNPDDMKKFTGLLRYSQGTATDGFSLTGMAYTNTWNSTDQNALRALHDRPNRPLWPIRSDRWRRHQPLLAVGPDRANHRRRIVESQCLSCQIHDGPMEQLHL